MPFPVRNAKADGVARGLPWLTCAFVAHSLLPHLLVPAVPVLDTISTGDEAHINHAKHEAVKL